MFEAVVEPVEWGRATYTLIRIPEDLAEAARGAATRRVSGTIDDVQVNLAITRAPVVEGPFVWAGQSLLRELGARAGDGVVARLRPEDPDAVDLPDEVAAALGQAGVRERWEQLRPARRRQLLYGVKSARSAATRSRRVSELVSELSVEAD